MLVLFLLLLLGSSSSSTPINIPDNHISFTLFGRQLPGCSLVVDAGRYRSTQEIIWSCLATIFACAWVAVHPNLSGQFDSKLTKFKRKLTIMFYALMAPEMMTAWALGQWSAAKRIAEDFNQANGRSEEMEIEVDQAPWYSLHGLGRWLQSPPGYPSNRWTRTHGFFIQMGGFILFEGNTPRRVLAYEDLQDLIDKGHVDAPTIREDEINDKSKGDLLTKSIIVLQTTWFVVQCIARWASHLPVTELEVVTLGFAALNVVTCALWFHKPQNVLVAVAVPLKVDSEKLNLMHHDGPVRGYENDIFGGRNGGKTSWVSSKMRKEAEKGWMGWVFGVPYRLLQALLRPANKIVTERKCRIRPDSLRVPMFYAGARENGISAFPLFIIGPLFGAIHLIPWSFAFPSITERWLWRSSVLFITFEPLVAMMTGFFPVNHGPFCGALLNVVLFMAMAGLPLYVFARVVLLVLAFVTLRQLPPDALVTVNWTTFVPHIA